MELEPSHKAQCTTNSVHPSGKLIWFPTLLTRPLCDHHVEREPISAHPSLKPVEKAQVVHMLCTEFRNPLQDFRDNLPLGMAIWRRAAITLHEAERVSVHRFVLMGLVIPFINVDNRCSQRLDFSARPQYGIYASQIVLPYGKSSSGLHSL